LDLDTVLSADLIVLVVMENPFLVKRTALRFLL